MKREVKAPGGAEVKSPEPPTSEEREFGRAIKYMVEQMAKRFRNQVFEELNQSTVEKFADETPALLDDLRARGYEFNDAQIGNFARVFLRLADKVRRKLVRQFDDDRLEQLSKNYTGKVNRRNAKEFYRRVEKRVGISREELESTEGLTFQINAYKLETFQWIRKMRDDTLQMWTSQTLRDMAEGRGLPEILSQFDDMVEKRKNHAEMVARTQISSFNSLTTKARAQNLGIEKAVWITSRDERVRRCHQVRDGKEFDLAEGLYSSCDGKTLLPGLDYNCFPGSVKINHSSLCQKLYRRWYSGELTEIVRDDGVVLHATPNHPILTVSGFKPAGEINVGDHIIGTLDESVNGIEFDGNDMIPTFEELFRSIDLLGVEHGIAPASRGKFHGDVSDGDIDVIDMNSLLVGEVNTSVRENFAELGLSGADEEIVLGLLTCIGQSNHGAYGLWGSSNSIMGLLDLVRSRLLVHLGPLELFCFALGSWADTGSYKARPDNAASDAEMFSDCVFALSVLVHGLYAFDRKINSFRVRGRSFGSGANLRKLLRECDRMNPDLLGDRLNGSAVSYKVFGVSDKSVSDFSGHVYNLQTMSGDYIANTTAVSNCRCDYRLLIPEMESE